MDKVTFQHSPTCSAQGCGQPAVYKVAAPWSNGTQRELKTYGLACEAHRQDLLARGKTSRKGLTLAQGENIGEVGVYQLIAGKRDAELPRLPE
jgi:hypothetical protein